MAPPPLPKTALSFRKHENIFAEGAGLRVMLLCSSVVGIVNAGGAAQKQQL